MTPTGPQLCCLIALSTILVTRASDAQLHFVDATGDSGLGPYTNAPGWGGGVAAADFDDDGDVDLFVPTAEGLPHLLYRNLGDGQFEDIASTVGLASLEAGRVALWVDYDGDQRLDLVVTADCFQDSVDCDEVRPIVLYRQGADGQFVDRTTDAGLTGDPVPTYWVHRAGLCGDLNNDDFLDLVMGAWNAPARVFLNDTDGTFTEISPGCGIGGVPERQWQPVIFDFNGDGWRDIFYAVDFTPNHLWINQGDDTFVDQAQAAGVDRAWNDMGVTLGDYDNDGDIDIYVTEIFRNGRHNLLYRNESVDGVMQFADVAPQLGVDNTWWGWGATFTDADRDGWLDIAATNGFASNGWEDDPSLFFLNEEGLGFVDVSTSSGFDDTYWGTTLITFDYDRDGDPDLVQTCNQGPLRLLENQLVDESNYLVVRPRMDGPNHRAIGAIVRVTAGDLDLMRVITAGTSHLGQEPAEAFFGLGAAAIADTVRVEWPNGTTTIVRDVAAGQVLDVASCGGGKDTTAPLVDVCPPDLFVHADAGVCETFVSWDAPVVTDDCDPEPLVTYDVDAYDDGEVEFTGQVEPSSVLPVGTHRVTPTVVDTSGNADASCSFLVEVSGQNLVVVDVELTPTIVGEVRRCIAFEFVNLTTGATEVVERQIEFMDGMASTASVLVPCGEWTCVTATDRLHTLARRDDDAFAVAGSMYVADFTSRIGEDDRLMAGNLNGDDFIDILDFGIFVDQYGSVLGDPGCTASAPHADVDGSGTVDTSDFTFIAANFGEGRDPHCSEATVANGTRREGPLLSITLGELGQRGLGRLSRADVNHDGRLDILDMAHFAQGARP